MKKAERTLCKVRDLTLLRLRDLLGEKILSFHLRNGEIDPLLLCKEGFSRVISKIHWVRVGPVDIWMSIFLKAYLNGRNT